MANEQAAKQGLPRIGFLNPVVYTLGATQAYPSLFHDQTSGTSGKFHAVPGFDLVTGFGSPRGVATIEGLLAPLSGN